MSDLDNPGVKAVITLGVLVLAGILAFVIAKLTRACMSSSYTDETDSGMSENTRDLIRARLSVIQFKKKELKKEKRQKTVNAFKKWKDFVKIKKKVGVLKENDSFVVNMEKLNGVSGKTSNGKIGNKTVDFEIKENGDIVEDCNETTPKLKRLSSLSAQLPPPTPRPSQNIQTLKHPPSSDDNSSPVPRGRPVSSKRRIMPNVTQTDLKRDPTMISLKAVHYEEPTDQKITTESANT